MMYTYKCDNCLNEETKNLPLSRYREVQVCKCGQPMYKSLSNAKFFVDYNIGKFDKNLGIYIESSDHRRRVMKEQGLEAVDSSYDLVGHVTKKKAEIKEKKADNLGKKMKEAMHTAKAVTVK